MTVTSAASPSRRSSPRAAVSPAKPAPTTTMRGPIGGTLAANPTARTALLESARRHAPPMTVLSSLLAAVDVVDLTTPLQTSTPILELPPPFANTHRFELEELSRYDEKGPAWYWNDIHTGEHTGTHLDAPVHWITGRDKGDVAQIAPGRLVAPAAVLDKAGADPDYLL